MNTVKSKASPYIKISRSNYQDLRQAAYRWYALAESGLIKPPEGYTNLTKYVDDLLQGKVKK